MLWWFGDMFSPRETFEKKMCNLVRLDVYFDQICNIYFNNNYFNIIYVAARFRAFSL